MRLNELFDISYGQHEYNSKGSLLRGGCPLISSQGEDNGCYGFFDICPKYHDPIVTVPRTGSIGQAFVQSFPCCVDDNCLVLEPKNSMSMEDLFGVALLLRENAWRFKYGRQITPRRIGHLDFITPKPKVSFESVYRRLMPKKKKRTMKYSYETSSFKLSDFFDVVKGTGGYFETLKKGKTPLISATTGNNGVIGYVGIEPVFSPPAITVDRISTNAFVQLYDFATVPDDIFVLIPIKNRSIEFLIYVAVQINQLSWRFNYSRKVTGPRLKHAQISLPTKRGIPDFKMIKNIVGQMYGAEILPI